MLSILIPIFNFNVTNLVEQLDIQAQKAEIEYEIILVDDASTTHKSTNSKLSDLKHVKYIELNKNIGRSKIRNYLSSLSNFKYLLFLDCDSAVEKQDFIEKYLTNASTSVIYGGRKYLSKKPPQDFMLHYTYGIKKETKFKNNNNLITYLNFKTNNFFIHKKIFDTIKFDEKLNIYGHEDTLFAYELYKNNVQIKFIDNPIIHIGLDKSAEFIKKSKEAISNLLTITKLYPAEKDFFKSINILKYFFLAEKLYLCTLLKRIYIITNKHIEKKLLTKKPNLVLFNLLKLTYLCFISKRH